MPNQKTTPQAQDGAPSAGLPACNLRQFGTGRMTEPPRGPAGPGAGV